MIRDGWERMKLMIPVARCLLEMIFETYEKALLFYDHSSHGPHDMWTGHAPTGLRVLMPEVQGWQTGAIEKVASSLAH